VDSEKGKTYVDDVSSCTSSTVEGEDVGVGAVGTGGGTRVEERLNDQRRRFGTGRSILTPRRTGVTGGAYLGSERVVM
jgi:hypothetical protein